MKQFAAVGLLSMLLSQGSISEAIVGGCSLGTVFAYQSTFELEACMASPRAVLFLDSRSLPPFRRVTSDGGSAPRVSPVLAVCRTCLCLMRQGSPAGVNFQFMGTLQAHLSAPLFDFTCPALQHEPYQDDSTVRARRSLLVTAGDDCFFPDTAHTTMVVDHYWDIARRLRGLLSSSVDDTFGQSSWSIFRCMRSRDKKRRRLSRASLNGNPPRKPHP